MLPQIIWEKVFQFSAGNVVSPHAPSLFQGTDGSSLRRDEPSVGEILRKLSQLRIKGRGVRGNLGFPQKIERLFPKLFRSTTIHFNIQIWNKH